MIGGIWRHPVVRLLTRDPFVLTFLALLAAELTFYLAAPAATPALRQRFGRAMFLVPFLILVAPAALVGLPRIADREERRFWRAIAVSSVALTAAVCVNSLTPAMSERPAAHLLVDALYLFSYLPLLLAVEWRPHHGAGDVTWEPDRWIHVFTACCVAGGWFVYFVVVPAWLDTSFYGSSIPTYLLYITLDLMLVSLYFFVGRRCRVPRWRVLYWAVAVACLATGVVDTLDLLTEAGVLGWRNGDLTDLLWTAPTLFYLLAIRIRHAPIGSGDRVEPGQPGFALEERARSGAMVLGAAFSFPLVHLWLQPALSISPELRRAQGLVVLVMLGVLGALAVVTYRLLSHRHRELAHTHRNLLHRLREGQRLDAIGRLAGGIAHDFNNMLTGVVGYNDMALDALTPDDPNRPALEQIASASDRAAALTQQLLALSRRQILKPERTNLNTIIGRTAPALARITGDRAQLVINLDPRLNDVLVDPSQLQSVVLGLATNARGAVPPGGTIEICTANVTLARESWPADPRRAPGDYVELSVRDNGPDIPLASQMHQFEPYFAAPGKGRGAGLGLAAVYGIVTQSGGTIDVRSQPGEGAAFVVRLPRAVDMSASKEPAP